MRRGVVMLVGRFVHIFTPFILFRLDRCDLVTGLHRSHLSFHILDSETEVDDLCTEGSAIPTGILYPDDPLVLQEGT